MPPRIATRGDLPRLSMTWSAFWEQLSDVLNFVLFTVGDQSVTLLDLAVATAIVFIASMVSRILRRALAPLAHQAEKFVGKRPVSLTLRILHWIIILLGVIVALQQVGISMNSLSGIFTAGAVVTVAVGFAMQNIAQNFVSGAILAAERTIKPGDVIEVEGRVVRVQRMGVRTTVARTREDEGVIIPNSDLVQNSVKNYTYEDSIYRLRAGVGVAYDSDMRRVMQVLREAVEGLEWRSAARKPVVFLTEFGSSSVNFEVSVWMNDPWRAPQARSDLMETVWWALKDAGITIAFPQMDLHLDPEVVDAMGHRRLGQPPSPAPEA
jgi:small-conductance mechanosensitive channel